MSVTPNSRFGPYEILELIGAGGMGEVYRARDTRLGREVAVKVLPAVFKDDPDRLARFEREARALASLNHSNIATLFGIEQADGVPAIVMELVGGDTLEQRLRAGGAMSMSETLAIARQIADALDAAHQRGIVHRDLKPANIKLSPEGVVKLLDFGIAKAVQGTDPRMTVEPATSMATEHGVILGTAPYMSPEQARGHPLDKRADIWAFGCVLYEMLTGHVAFEAATSSDTIARILGAEPDWQAVPPSTPPGVVRLLRRCLEKDPRRRLRDIGDVDLALDAPAAPSVSKAPASRVLLAIVAGLLMAIAGAALAIGFLRPDAPSPEPSTRFELPASIRLADSGAFALSPDGRRLAFIGTGADGILRIWQRSFDEIETRPLIGTENEVGNNTTLWWSPDSRFIGFYADGKIKKVDSAGGTPQVICNVTAVSVGGAWGQGGTVVVGHVGGGLLRCPAAGGAAAPVTTTESSDPTEVHLLPSFLPDSRRLLYLRVSRNNPARTGVYLADLERASDQQSHERLLATNFGAEFVASADGTGRVLFMRDTALWAAPFDVRQGAVTGEPVQIAAPVGSFRDGGLFHASTRALAYRQGVADYQLTWFDRQGKPIGVVGEPGQYAGVALSPDDKRAAVVRDNRLNRTDSDVWLIDLQRDLTTRLTTDPLPESVPAWLDDQTVMYVTGQSVGNVWSHPVSGAARNVLSSRNASQPIRINTILTTLSATTNAEFVLFAAEGLTETRTDTWILPVRGGGPAVPLLQQRFDESQASMSPDGRWIAYVSNESGANEVFVRPATTDPSSGLPRLGPASLVSKGGGLAPRWRRDSRELFFLTAAGGVMAAEVTPKGTLASAQLFEATGAANHWGVSADGQRFLMAVPVKQDAPAFTVVVNWQSPLAR
jgi:Tol biopolymer transport system component